MDRSILLKNLKHNLKYYRAKKNISQKEAAEIFGISLSAYQKYELGDRNFPAIPTLIAMADYYNISIDDLIGRTSTTNNNPASLFTLMDQTYKTASDDVKQEINTIMLNSFTAWLEKTNTERKILKMDTSNRKIVYVNFESASPHSPFMHGTYDKTESHAFFEIPSDVGKASMYMAAGDYNIGWTDDAGTHHIEHIIAGENYFFPSDIVTDEPKF